MTNSFIPVDVPTSATQTFFENYQLITKSTDRLFLFAADQKMEHLNSDFVGSKISAESADPRHLFRIAQHGTIGAFATQLGLIARYGKEFSDIPYIVKLNSKTNTAQPSKWQKFKGTSPDPISPLLWTVEQVIEFKKTSGLNICGIGLSLYLGSEHEALMLHQAAQAIYHAHQAGLVTLAWIYPRGKYVTGEKQISTLAGAAGVGLCLGADFVKVHAPETKKLVELKQIVTAAGNAGVICSGGPSVKKNELLKRIDAQLKAGMRGCAIGRNIFQKPLAEAISLTQALAGLVYGT